MQEFDAFHNKKTTPLFDAALEGYFWDYDNNGLKLAQLRFYPVPTDINQP